MNVDVSEIWGPFIRSQVQSGRFTSEGEVLGEALRLLRQRDREVGRSGPSQPDREETVFDVLRDSGLIGAIESSPDSPNDLSTNPEHMRGFGGE